MEFIANNMRIKTLAVLIGLLIHSGLSHGQNFHKDIIPRVDNIYVGFGPSFMYGDNAGGLRNYQFKVRPAASISYGRKINPFFEIKGTVGFQMLESQDPGYYADTVLAKWAETGQAIGIKGNAYHIDIMPVFQLTPFDKHIERNDINVFVGIGLGAMVVDKEEARIINNQPEIKNISMSLVYIPVRGGLSYRLGPHDDLALEASFFATFTDDIDGNTGHNRFNDHLFQGKMVYKRYLSPFPFWQKLLR